jgi:transcriptional regulator with XRE-family HTH domain
MNNIKKVLKEQGRSQRWLVKKIGMSYSSIGNYCNNVTQPSGGTLRVIASAMEIDVRVLQQIVPASDMVKIKPAILSDRALLMKGKTIQSFRY